MLDDLASVGVENARKSFVSQLDDMLSGELQIPANHLAVTAIDGTDVALELHTSKLTVANQEKFQAMISSQKLTFTYSPPGGNAGPITLAVTKFGGGAAAAAVATESPTPAELNGNAGTDTVTIVAVVVGSIVVLAVIVGVVLVRKRSSAVSFNSFEAADSFSNPIYDSNQSGGVGTAQLQGQPSFA